MNLRRYHVLKVASLLCTATINLLLADPIGFIIKVLERVRQSGVAGAALPEALLRLIQEREQSTARQLIAQGHLTRGILALTQHSSKVTSGDIHLAKRTAEKLQQLSVHPRSGSGFSREISDTRVLHLLTNSQPFTNSGYTVRSQHVLESQQAVGIKTRAVTRLGYPVLVGKLPATQRQIVGGVEYRRLLPWIYPMSLPEQDRITIKMLVDEALQFGATALHTTTDFTNALVVAEAAAELDIPWVYEVRGELESTWLSRQPEDSRNSGRTSEFYSLARAQEQKCMTAATAVVALSEVSKAQMVDRGVSPQKIHVIPNAVDENLIGMAYDQINIREELKLPLNRKLVGSVTSVVGYEGLNTLIDSLRFLPEDWTVLVVGDGVELPALRRQARESGVADRCLFVGRKCNSEIWKWYAALDVFVVPRVDTLVTRTVTPIKPLTAMALGVPVVASDLPALREVTGEVGTYVPAGAVRQFANAIELSYRQPQSAGVLEWLRGRTWSANARRYAELYLPAR